MKVAQGEFVPTATYETLSRVCDYPQRKSGDDYQKEYCDKGKQEKCQRLHWVPPLSRSHTLLPSTGDNSKRLPGS